MKIRNRFTGKVLLEIEKLENANLEEANLAVADLRGADLRGADLKGALLPNTDAVLICPWSICHIQRKNIRIGCEYHTTEEWRDFSDERISSMDSRALEWWKHNRETVLYIASKCGEYK